MNREHTDSHKWSDVDECVMIDLPRRQGDNGCLTEVENADACPFEIKRVYYLYDVPADSERGGHSHIDSESLLVAVSGSFDVVLDDGKKKKRVTLNRPYKALHLRKGIWRRLENFSAGSVCLVINSAMYDPDDYVRDYDEFLRRTRIKENAQPRYPFLQLGTVNAPYTDELKEAVGRVIDSGCYIGGPEVEALEEELKPVTETEYVVAVSNGLDALRLIFRSYIEMGKLRPGDEVLVPSDTFIASVLAVTDNGLVPVFVEPRIDTFNIDSRLLHHALTPRTKAILTVHLYGQVCWDAGLAEFAKHHGLIVVEDNAQAIGARALMPGLYGTYASGGLGHAGAFSFYPTKNVGALGDAGAITTHDAELAAVARALRNYGTDRQYHNVYAGLNCRMDPIQAAMIRVKLPHLHEENAHRRRLAEIYSQGISNPAVVTPRMPISQSGDPQDAANSHVWHQYVVRVADRDDFRKYLMDKGVETGVHYPVAPHQQPCYAQFSSLRLPIAEQIAREVVSLPISTCTSAQDTREICEIINGYAKL